MGFWIVIFLGGSLASMIRGEWGPAIACLAIGLLIVAALPAKR